MLDRDIKVGILGGGQLGAMLIKSAVDYGIYVHVLDTSYDANAARFTSNFTIGDTLDYDAVLAFGKGLDVITIEKEAVNVDALEELQKQGIKVHPSPHVIRTIQDKYLQKQYLQEHNIPVAKGTLIKNKEELAGYSEQLPACLKLCRDGYDGKGVMILKQQSDFEKAFDKPSVLEELVDIDKELAVIVARNEAGEVKCYDPVEMVFDAEMNILDYQLAPADITEEQAKTAIELALKTGEAFDLVGIMAVELFLTVDGNIIVNELAPRPHNSGHHTIEACVTSQYEQLIRAILGISLGDTSINKPSAMMNILQPVEGKIELLDKLMTKALATSDAHLHWYGKKNSKEGRKIGHVTINGSSIEDALAKAESIRGIIK